MNINTDIFNSSLWAFIWILILISVWIAIIFILDFIKKRDSSKNAEVDPSYSNNLITTVLTIYSKVFKYAGWAFMIGNIFLKFVNIIESQAHNDFNIIGTINIWNNFLFGLIILFISIGLNQAKKELKKTEK